MPEFKFEKLEVWQKAVNYADAVYRDTNSFPRNEDFGLSSQLRRAAVSISSNVAEGNARSSRADYARFVEIAYGSLMETVSQRHISQRRGYLSRVDFDHLLQAADELSRMLSGLRSSL